ncbi:MAG TPA: nicotinate-nucleotide adenylyltransferase [Beijerinckiaceae bacterium]|nr:nicotinate-nucleotide adenylyltransferase [Beijerinckiaceae bacterium]
MAALPPHAPGMRIGLLGGTFDPSHEGHRLASLTALRRLGLDRIWWLVTPGNPLKQTEGLSPLAVRLSAARLVAADPRILVSGFEAQIGARYTYQTIRYLRRRCPGVRFVWIMGADNLASFHRWRRWREIMDSIAIAVVDRPGATLHAAHSPAGERLARFRLREADGKLLCTIAPPAYIFLHGPRSSLSSTELRRLRPPPEEISATGAR